MCELCSAGAVDRRRLLKVGLATSALTLVWPRWSAAADADTGALVEDLTILPRSAWAGPDRPPLSPVPEEQARFLLVHHSASGNNYGEADVAPLLRSFYDFHTGPEKQWPDIAYNFLIDRFGRIWEGRVGSLSGLPEGSATGGNQGFSQLVCVIGDFSTAEPSDAALESLRRTLAWLAERASVSTAPGSIATFESLGSNLHPAGVTVTTPTITSHRTMSQTTCPGDVLHTYVSDGLMRDVDELRASLAPDRPTTTETTPEIAGDPAAIEAGRSSSTVTSSSTTSTSMPGGPGPSSDQGPVSTTGDPSSSTSVDARQTAAPDTASPRTQSSTKGIVGAAIAAVVGGVAGRQIHTARRTEREREMLR